MPVQTFADNAGLEQTGGLKAPDPAQLEALMQQKLNSQNLLAQKADLQQAQSLLSKDLAEMAQALDDQSLFGWNQDKWAQVKSNLALSLACSMIAGASLNLVNPSKALARMSWNLGSNTLEGLGRNAAEKYLLGRDKELSEGLLQMALNGLIVGEAAHHGEAVKGLLHKLSAHQQQRLRELGYDPRNPVTADQAIRDLSRQSRSFRAELKQTLHEQGPELIDARNRQLAEDLRQRHPSISEAEITARIQAFWSIQEQRQILRQQRKNAGPEEQVTIREQRAFLKDQREAIFAAGAMETPGLIRAGEAEAFLQQQYGADFGSRLQRAYQLAAAELDLQGVAGSFARGNPRVKEWPKTFILDGQPETLTVKDAALLDKIPTPDKAGRLWAVWSPRQKALSELKARMLQEPGRLPSDLDLVTAQGDMSQLKALKARIFDETGILVEFCAPQDWHAGAMENWLLRGSVAELQGLSKYLKEEAQGARQLSEPESAELQGIYRKLSESQRPPVDVLSPTEFKVLGQSLQAKIDGILSTYAQGRMSLEMALQRLGPEGEVAQLAKQLGYTVDSLQKTVNAPSNRLLTDLTDLGRNCQSTIGQDGANGHVMLPDLRIQGPDGQTLTGPELKQYLASRDGRLLGESILGIRAEEFYHSAQFMYRFAGEEGFVSQFAQDRIPHDYYDPGAEGPRSHFDPEGDVMARILEMMPGFDPENLRAWQQRYKNLPDRKEVLAARAEIVSLMDAADDLFYLPLE